MLLDQRLGPSDRRRIGRRAGEAGVEGKKRLREPQRRQSRCVGRTYIMLSMLISEQTYGWRVAVLSTYGREVTERKDAQQRGLTAGTVTNDDQLPVGDKKRPGQLEPGSEIAGA